MVNQEARAEAHENLPHPNQPLSLDGHGILRFKENKIVNYILENGGIDLNQIACVPFSQEDREQFAQLIGYSLGGFGELPYVSDKAYYTAQKEYDNRVAKKDKTKSTIDQREPNIIVECDRVKIGCSDRDDDDDFGNISPDFPPKKDAKNVSAALMGVDTEDLLKKLVEELGKDQIQIWLDEQ